MTIPGSGAESTVVPTNGELGDNPAVMGDISPAEISELNSLNGVKNFLSKVEHPSGKETGDASDIDALLRAATFGNAEPAAVHETPAPTPIDSRTIDVPQAAKDWEEMKATTPAATSGTLSSFGHDGISPQYTHIEDAHTVPPAAVVSEKPIPEQPKDTGPQKPPKPPAPRRPLPPKMPLSGGATATPPFSQQKQDLAAKIDAQAANLKPADSVVEQTEPVAASPVAEAPKSESTPQETVKAATAETAKPPVAETKPVAEPNAEQKKISELEEVNQKLIDKLEAASKQQKERNEKAAQLLETMNTKFAEQVREQEKLTKALKELMEGVAKKNKTEVTEEKEAAGDKKTNKDAPVAAPEANEEKNEKAKELPEKKDSAEMYKLYRFGTKDKDLAKKMREMGRLSPSEIGRGANKYFDELKKFIVNGLRTKSDLIEARKKERKSFAMRALGMGLVNQYRKSAHNEGVNKINAEMRSLEHEISAALKTITKVEKDTRKAPEEGSRKVKRNIVATLKELAK